MAWIKLPKPPLDALRGLRDGLPDEYKTPPSALQPEAVGQESIVGSHAHVPEAMVGLFSGFNALMAPDLPLSRKEHEMIATVVSGLNDCFY
jgi:hypothetical protein